ncbi:MAG TPA: 2-oxo acid dehydrogenase subunit E2, partial [Thermoanaerobacter sp.]|nr:2-oxo acid dehydrogenase subunit E2 [Thermoanaerobacter sp.]
MKATPVAKRLAKENNIDLSLITGTGPGGRITEEDVKKFISEQKVKTEE